MACSCPPTQATGAHFTDAARRYARQFRRRGLAREQRLLLEGICRGPVEGITVLEVGCGVGGLHLTLLQRGARRAVGVDMAEGMLEGARVLSAELGLADRSVYLLGDAVGLGEAVPAADLVVMDKVVCCYEDLPALLAMATAKAHATLALAYPRPVFHVALSFKLLIAIRRLFRTAFIPSWHDWRKMVEEIEGRGFKARERSSTFLWAVAVFERNGVGARHAAGGGAELAVIRRATPADAAAIAACLEEAHLASGDITDLLAGFLVAEAGGRVIGTIGMERYGTTGLLRSAAVLPAHRSGGLGRRLVAELERHAGGAGISEFYLLTTTAERFFGRQGYAAVDRASVTGPVTSSGQFQGACPSTAVVMRKILDRRS